ncbi:hypothetical protein [Jiella sonneratiae]|uniref:Uncharacterized protein n=1 Tax=Jiella sonneratiae TaxID=2816856 RepID=A0ABS3J9F1_9HYPH|nr:hypothetical protein [Jiella sonneratiae]MBO0906299.1 hypothetical protein [Jiella sonneratiae]
MTFKRNTTSAPAKPDPKAPVLLAYTVREAKDEGQKNYWTRIGAFFEHEDGDGGTLVLDALPLNGRIVLRVPPKDDAAKGQA